MKKSLYQLSLEQEDDEDQITLVDVANDISDVVESEAVCADYGTQLDKAVNVVVKLNNIAEVVDSHDEAESDVDSHILELALEGLYQDLGMKLPKRLSMEDANGSTWKERGARIKEQILELLRAISEVLRRAYMHLRVHLEQQFKLAARMERYAAQELRHIRSIKGDPTVASYNNESLAKRIVTPDTPMLEGYERLFTFVEDAERSGSSGFARKVADMVNAYVEGKDVTSLIEQFPRLFEETYSGIFEHDATNSLIQAVGAPEGVEVHTTKPMPGGYYGVIGVPKTTDDLGQFIFAIRRPEDHEHPPAALKVLSMEDIRWSLDTIVKVCSRIRRFEITEKRNGNMVDLLDKAAVRLRRSEIEHSEEDKKFLRALARVAPTLARGIHQQTFSYALSAFRGLIEHCQHSASTYSAPNAATVSASTQSKE